MHYKIGGQKKTHLVCNEEIIFVINGNQGGKWLRVGLSCRCVVIVLSSSIVVCCCVLLCGVVCCCVWCLCLWVCAVCLVWKNRRVYIRNVPVSTGNTSTCVKHVGVLPVHTETF